MANFAKKLFAGPDMPDSGAEGEQPKVNSELDDEMPYPEGVEPPSIDKLADFVEGMTPEVEAKENEADEDNGTVTGDDPTTPRPPFESPKHQRRSSAVDQFGDSSDDREDDIDPDLLSVTTDINRHGRDIDDLRTQMRGMNRKLDMFPEFDSSTRRLDSSIKELMSRVSDLASSLSGLQKSFNAYQSITSNKIADVERRAALRQLDSEVKPDEDLIPPPDTVSSLPAPAAPPLNPNLAKTEPAKKKVASMSDW